MKLELLRGKHMAQMAAPNQNIIKISCLFFDPSRESASVGRAVLQSAGLINAQYHLDVDLAVEYQASTPSELIIVDLSPDTKKNGLKLIKEVRSIKLDKSPRVLGLLASATRENLIEAIKGGVDTVEVKPLVPSNLYKKINSLFAAPQNYFEAKNYYGPDRRRIPSKEEFSGEERRDDVNKN